MLANWGSRPPNNDPRADPDGNGLVAQGDLDIVLADWGQGTAPPPVPGPTTLATFALASVALLRRKGKS